MLQFNKSLKAWNTSQFNSVFIQQVEQLSLDDLPLQTALQLGSYATKDNIKVMINSKTEQTEYISISAGIFYSSIIAGCNCSDDPTPVDLSPAYCEMRFTINKATGQTVITITS